jgi:two-component system, response regulator YesN
MYNVLVVDDEPIVRLALKSLVPWQSHGFLVDLEASNGKQALKIIKENSNIDIVITDINMPVMDGLELMEELNKLGYKMPVIVLSAYNDYKLVRQAFKLGAKDYILKTELNQQNTLQMLQNVIQEEKFEDGYERKLSRNENSNYLKYKKNEYLKNLIDQNANLKTDFSFEELGIKFTGDNFLACFIWIDDYNEVSRRYSSSTLNSFIDTTANSINQVLLDISMGEVIVVSPQEYVVILSFKCASYSEINSRTRHILERIEHSLLSYINLSVTIGVSDIKGGIGSIAELRSQAERNARLRFIYGKGKIIFPETASVKTVSKVKGISEVEEKLFTAFVELNIEAVMKEMDSFCNIIQSENNINIKKIHSEYMRIVFRISKSLSDMGGNILDIFEEEADIYDKITKFETLNELNLYMKDVIGSILKYLYENRKNKRSKTMVRALDFIKHNYSNNELNLNMVSDHVGLSENHFSTLFAKEAGETFTSYLNHIRIEKAKQLIAKTNLKMYEICDKVGYTNVEYFSRVFKKITGVSPNTFKGV